MAAEAACSAFSLRSLYPLAQVANNDLRLYNYHHRTDPQPGIGAEEERLKNYFHGRIWAVRKSTDITNLADSVIGDDIYIATWVYSVYGPGSIQSPATFASSIPRGTESVANQELNGLNLCR